MVQVLKSMWRWKVQFSWKISSLEKQFKLASSFSSQATLAPVAAQRP